jgi:hypothetical protein
MAFLSLCCQPPPPHLLGKLLAAASIAGPAALKEELSCSIRFQWIAQEEAAEAELILGSWIAFMVVGPWFVQQSHI